MQVTDSRLRRLIAVAGTFMCAVVLAKDAAPPPGTATVSACNAVEYRQFDFWLGKWQVMEAGKPAGRSEIQADLNGCALFESWTSIANTRGRSINFYDRNIHRWHQTWIDDRGGALQLDGGIKDGSMVLEQERTTPETGQQVVNRITWTPNPDGSVWQHWEVRKGADGAWATVFDAIYRRAK